MPLTIVRQDITKMEVDAIVNAANTDLRMGGGVCGAIFRAAGEATLQAACTPLAPIETGAAVITPGFALPCRYVIHAAGPIYHPLRAERCAQQLRAAYTSALQLAAENHCQSIAFPLISSGIYGYPKEKALTVATAAIRAFLETHVDMEVYLAVFSKEAFSAGKALLGEIKSYIDDHYIELLPPESRRLRRTEEEIPFEQRVSLSGEKAFSLSREKAFDLPDELSLFVGELDEPFNQTLLSLIDSKNKTDVEVYKRANISRKLFSKIRSGNGYMPGKRTVLALAIALELSLSETEALLKCAGYALSHSQIFDVIVEYFIVKQSYDIFQINEVLFQYDQPLLGAN